MEVKKLIEVLHIAEKLKNNTRHSWTSTGRHESVAEHTFRMTIMAYFMKDEFPDADMDKVIHMCMFHDIGEAFTGDIPCFNKTDGDEALEEKLLDEWVKQLEPPYDTELAALYAEMEDQQTDEAKIYRAIDKLEVTLQHNEADIKTWIPLEYTLNIEHGTKEVQFSEYLKQLKAAINADSVKKIADSKPMNELDNEEQLQEKRAELIMLGTGHAMVTRCYNTCFAIRQMDSTFLVDAGGGNKILEQMEKAQLSFADVHNMFVTHAHTDHILGVIWVIRKIATMMGAGKYEGDFTIYCHDEAAHILKTICDLTLVKKFTKLIGDRILIVPVLNGEEKTIDDMQVTFFDILSTKTKQFGFRAVLKDQTVITCMGDEPYNPECRQYIEGSDWLLSEAFCLYEERDTFKPYEKHHSTAKDAACLARELKVPNLVLYHTEDSDLPHRKERYTKEAGTEFTGNVFVPEDLEVITV